MRPAIETTDLKKSFNGVEALKGISLDVSEGEIYGLIGPDGAGKTTLIRILISLLLADSGTSRIMGLDPEKEYRALRNIIGYMPGRFSLYQDLTVEENLALFASIYKTTIQENYHLVRDIYVQLEPFKTRRAGALSGGMKQKLALCCAMIHRPEILFLDEPTTGVDPVSRKEFWDMLGNLNKSGLTILVSTPYMDEAERCHTVALMQNGSIMAVDTPEKILNHFKGSLFSVKGKPSYRIMQDLRSLSTCRMIYPFGSVLHCSAGTDVKAEDISAFLSTMGHNDVVVTLIQPSIEDTFISLMTHDS